MKISIFQQHPLHKGIRENEKNIIRLSENTDADILLFPELALSGYFFTDKKELYGLAHDKDSDFIQKLREICISRKKCIATGFAESAGGAYYNSSILVFPDGSYHVYRKTHLFYKEPLIFEKGNTGFNVYEHPAHDIKIGLMICYDWRFPEAARTLALKGADLILCPSNLVTGVWSEAMRTRALENKVFIAVANRVGRESNGDEELVFNGRSAFIGCTGRAIAEASAENEEMLTCTFDPAESRDKSFNPFNDIFKDRRPGLYFK